MNQQSPMKFGDYYLIDHLATGGMAEIWRAKTIGLEGFERVVAIKYILPTYTQNAEFNAMFIDEARIASSLTHNNIVRITNFGVIDNKYYHEIEFVEGRNLRQLLRKCRDSHVEFPIDSACYIMSEVCKGLHYAHMKHDSITNQPLNIIHRDMSPQNVMLSYEGEVKIIDWGIAKAVGKMRMEETRAGVLKGKFGYMSPEQAEGEELDLRTDIFSIGIVLYEVLTGERLFVADTEINTLKKVKKGIVPLPSKVNPKIDKELETIVLKALAHHKIERYQSCFDIHEDLVHYLHKRFPTYTSLKLSQFIKEIFSDEIVEDRKRISEMEHSVSSYSAIIHAGELKEEETKLSVATGVEEAPIEEEEEEEEEEKTSFEEPTTAEEEPTISTVPRAAELKTSVRRFRKPLLFVMLLVLFGIIYFSQREVAIEEKEAKVPVPPVSKLAEEKPVVPPALKLGNLHLSTVPVPAKVLIDGTLKGKTPITVSELVIGRRYQLTLRAKGFETVTKFFTLMKGDINLSLPLKPVAQKGVSYLSIEVDPPVLIYIDGKLVSRFKPLFMYRIKPGIRKIRFRSKRLKIDYSMRVKVEKGKHVKKRVSLR